MELNELVIKAEQGDLESIMGLVQHYSSIHDWPEATKWADAAAEQGNDEAKYRSVIYHSIAIENYREKAAPFWDLLLKKSFPAP